MCIGRGFIMNNRRWYDSNEYTEKALTLLKDLDETKRKALSKDLTVMVKQIKEMWNCYHRRFVCNKSQK